MGQRHIETRVARAVRRRRRFADKRPSLRSRRIGKELDRICRAGGRIKCANDLNENAVRGCRRQHGEVLQVVPAGSIAVTVVVCCRPVSRLCGEA